MSEQEWFSNATCFVSADISSSFIVTVQHERREKQLVTTNHKIVYIENKISLLSYNKIIEWMRLIQFVVYVCVCSAALILNVISSRER